MDSQNNSLSTKQFDFTHKTRNKNRIKQNGHKNPSSSFAADMTAKRL